MSKCVSYLLYETHIDLQQFHYSLYIQCVGFSLFSPLFAQGLPEITVAVGHSDSVNEDLYGEIIYGSRFYTRIRLARKPGSQDWEMTRSTIELCVVFHHFAIDLNASRSLEEEPGSVLVFNLLRGVVKLGSSYADTEQVSDDYVGKFQALCMHDEMSTTFLRALSRYIARDRRRPGHDIYTQIWSPHTSPRSRTLFQSINIVQVKLSDCTSVALTFYLVIGLSDGMFTLFLEMSSSTMCFQSSCHGRAGGDENSLRSHQ